jgi:hypothetical protein
MAVICACELQIRIGWLSNFEQERGKPQEPGKDPSVNQMLKENANKKAGAFVDQSVDEYSSVVHDA